MSVCLTKQETAQFPELDCGLDQKVSNNSGHSETQQEGIKWWGLYPSPRCLSHMTHHHHSEKKPSDGILSSWRTRCDENHLLRCLEPKRTADETQEREWWRRYQRSARLTFKNSQWFHQHRVLTCVSRKPARVAQLQLPVLAKPVSFKNVTVTFYCDASTFYLQLCCLIR